eukprot:TRINITY_DN2807_c0_g1_i2.p1 TRINITY_DN2807_c0_g1~~TRINITY_DN2807_c0_g1_i2.p1  ORF type:complete len:501 (+),score=34.66 TRINITY_DN2807_c0_g1_i2:454-1956(+)
MAKEALWRCASLSLPSHHIDNDPHLFRIITSFPPHKEVVVASTQEDIEIAFEILKRHVIPQIKDELLNYTEALNTVAEITKDIQARFEAYLEASNSPILYSFTFEYQYVKPRALLKQEKPHLHCPICSCIVVEPVTLKHSKYNLLFCQSCILKEMYLGHQENEVNNQAGLLLEVASKEVAQELDNLEVLCPFRFNGCNHVERRASIHRHIGNCPKVKFICTNKNFGCTFNCTTVDDIAKHTETCQIDFMKWDLIKATIPDEVYVFGLQGLSVSDIVKCSILNKRMHRIITESSVLWRCLCERDGFLSSTPILSGVGSWRELYKLLYIQRFSQCSRCGQRHDETSSNEYHPGRWRDLSYPEFLESQNIKVTKPQPSDGALFLTQHRYIDQPLTKMMNGAKYGGIGAAYIAALAGGATRSLLVGSVAGITLGLPVIFAGAFGGLAYGVGQLIASPWQSNSSATSDEQEAAPKSSIGLEAWTCCGGEGSFAFPCSKCPKFLAR